MSALTFPVVTFSGNRFKKNSDMTPSQYVSVNVYSVCHLTKSIHGNNMFSTCCKLALGNNRFAEVYTMKKTSTEKTFVNGKTISMQANRGLVSMWNFSKHLYSL